MPAKNRKIDIFVTGGDDWALGTEERLARKCLATFANVVDDPKRADFMHTVDVEKTARQIHRGLLRPTIPIVGAVNMHPSRLIEWPAFFTLARRYMHLVPQSRIAESDMKRLGMPCIGRSRIATDSDSYFPMSRDHDELKRLRQRLAIPDDTYLIGLLQRDSEGRDLSVPKRQKGPDIFLALMICLQQHAGHRKFHVLIGGPRRHWIRSALREECISHSFFGETTPGDDYPKNIIDKQTMCRLYNLLDLYVIPTRWEGAPRQVFDVLECRRSIISTSVGIAPEVLPPDCVFHSIPQGASLILKDYDTRFLSEFIPGCRDRIGKRHSIPSVGEQWRKIYGRLKRKDHTGNGRSTGKGPRLRSDRSVAGAIRSRAATFLFETTRLGQVKRDLFPTTIAAAPWDSRAGALLERLGDKLRERRVETTRNWRKTKNILRWFERGEGRANNWKAGEKRIILVLDEDCCRLLLERNGPETENLRYWMKQAETTILTSDRYFARIDAAGASPINPVVIRFPPDPAVFHPAGGTASSDRPKPKCLVFVDSGPDALSFRKAIEKAESGISFTQIDSVRHGWMRKPPPERAEAIRRHEFAMVVDADLPETAVCELLTCGLPCLYRAQEESHRRLIGMAGVGVPDAASCLSRIAELRGAYRCLRSAILLPSTDEAAITLANIAHRQLNAVPA